MGRACAHSTPLPGSEEALRAFNLGRRVWRTAAHVVAIVATAPTAVAASPRPGKGGAEFGGSSDGGALPPAMRDECRVAFAQFDVNGDGKISLNELRTAMRKLGAREARAEELMAAIDSNHDGVIDFAEFCKTVAPLYDGASGALRDVFDFIDAAGDGVISRQEASRIVANLCDMSSRARRDVAALLRFVLGGRRPRCRRDGVVRRVHPALPPPRRVDRLDVDRHRVSRGLTDSLIYIGGLAPGEPAEERPLRRAPNSP